MKLSTLSVLKSVTEAKFQKEYQQLRPVLEAEAQIQRQLLQLDAQMMQVRRDSCETQGYRITGTDILWNSWESTTRRQLNTDLARVRARKLAALDALKLEFGRNRAVQDLSDALVEDLRRTTAKKRCAHDQ